MENTEKQNTETPLTLAEINERLKQISNQQAALLTAENYTPQQLADISQAYQKEHQKYKRMQQEAIPLQEVNSPIVVTNKS